MSRRASHWWRRLCASKKRLLLGSSAVLAVVAFKAAFVWPASPRRPVDQSDDFARLNITSDPALNPVGCAPKRRFGYLKTHKTGSTTLQNILLRYGYDEELNFLLSPGGRNFLHRIDADDLFKWSDQLPWHADFMRLGLYDAYAFHGQWNYQKLRMTLGPEAVMLTILRDPAATFESAYGYAHVADKTGVSFHQFVERLDGDGLVSSSWRAGKMGLNGMASDLLLLRPLEVDNQDVVDSRISKLDSEMDLVLIAELMDESLVLLAHLLCIPLFRVASIDKNARINREELTQDERIVLKRHQFADERLYQFFRKKLEVKIGEFGEERMAASVLELRRLRRELSVSCDDRGASSSNNHVTRQRIARTDIRECLLLKYAGEAVTKMVRKRQGERYQEWKDEQGN